MFLKANHARVLGDWKARQSTVEKIRNIIIDVSDVDDLRWRSLQVRKSSWWQTPATDCVFRWYQHKNFNSVDSLGMLRFIPMNYPKHLWAMSHLWWNAADILTALIKEHGLQHYLKILLDDLASKLKQPIWDGFKWEEFLMDVAVVAMIGDLKGHNLLFLFPQSFSVLWHWCPTC